MIYVDWLCSHGFKYGKSCHLFGDQYSELMMFAVKIGLKPAWIHVSKSGILHFDLTESKRKKAVKAGAHEMTKKDFINFYKKMRGKNGKNKN